VTVAVTILHVLVGVMLIVVVLLQAGKGADIGAAFGGASQTFFGGRGAATFLAKATAVAAGLFMLTSLYLARVSVGPGAGSSVIEGAPVTEPAPAAPGAPAAPAPAVSPGS
jgi:preprotein translocase subunit SecG